jgi:hypothetical protein
MVIAMLAWVFRFGLFAYGDPVGNLWMIVLSCIVYGMAFDFFNYLGIIVRGNFYHTKNAFLSSRLIYDDDQWLRSSTW